MIKMPFNPVSFSQDAKELVSGVNLTFQYDNIKSRLSQTAVELQKSLGKATYDALVECSNTNSAGEKQQLAVDYLKRAMLNFSFYNHLIFIAVRISNDGVTTKKNDDETTAFKYQTDEIKISLVESAWFWMDQLYALMDSDKESFSEWHESEQKAQLEKLYVKSADFAYIFGIDSIHFFVTCMPLIRKVMEEEITPRISLENLAVEETDSIKLKALKAEIAALIKKTIVYRSLSLACKLYSYYELPSPIRKSADNEMHKGTSQQDHVKTSVSGLLANQADSALQKLEGKVQALQNSSAAKGPLAIYPENKLNESDSFFFTL